MAELGRAALIVTLGLSLYALIAGGYAARAAGAASPTRRGTRCSRSFFSTLVAPLCSSPASSGRLLLAYVAAHSSRSLPPVQVLGALGRAGGLPAALAAHPHRVLRARRLARAEARTRPRRLGDACARRDRGRVLVAARRRLEPVRRDRRARRRKRPQPEPPEPVHGRRTRVLLYLGYVGLAVPFAFAMGALLSGRTDERWIVATRRWTLVAWTALGVGQLLGAHWAYEEVGWGGYYAWDPVENAALMPWLAATAFLHSVMIQEKRGMLRVWNVSLVSARVLPLALRHVPHPLRRRQLDPLVHAELDRPVVPRLHRRRRRASRSPMIWLRLPQLRSTTRLESLVSREATFLYNNLLLVALCLTILWGTAWPILSEAVRGESVVVGQAVLRLLPARLRAAAAPADGDRAARRVAARLAPRARRAPSPSPAGIALVAGVVLIALGAGSSMPGPDRLHVLGLRARRRSARSSCGERRHAVRSTGESVAERVRHG